MKLPENFGENVFGDAVPVCFEKKNIDVFVRNGVYTEQEAIALGADACYIEIDHNNMISQICTPVNYRYTCVYTDYRRRASKRKSRRPTAPRALHCRNARNSRL